MFRTVFLFLDSFSVHHQQYSTVHTAIGVCHTAGSGWSTLIPLASSQHNLYDIYLLPFIQY